ncbi:pentapeptide repeat-containing protein, partial [Candidatus Dependentiae bacterium]|nr:pentapeptide repeat-containing protein [Candidatus Dependentiae bacterium]
MKLLYLSLLLAATVHVYAYNEQDYQAAKDGIKQLSNADLSNANLVGIDLSNTDLSNANLSHAQLAFSNLQESDLTQAQLVGADLTNAQLSHATLHTTDLSNACLTNACLQNTNATNANFTNCTGVLLDLKNAHIENARFIGARLIKSHFNGAQATSAYFTHADLTGANFMGTILEHANFDKAILVDIKTTDTRLLEFFNPCILPAEPPISQAALEAAAATPKEELDQDQLAQQVSAKEKAYTYQDGLGKSYIFNLKNRAFEQIASFMNSPSKLRERLSNLLSSSDSNSNSNSNGGGDRLRRTYSRLP